MLYILHTLTTTRNGQRWSFSRNSIIYGLISDQPVSLKIIIGSTEYVDNDIAYNMLIVLAEL